MSNAEELGRAFIQQIENRLHDNATWDANRNARVAELEAKGYRIVDGGGQISPDGEEEAYADWRTGEELPSRSDNWYHIDTIDYNVDIPETVNVTGLPESLIEVINEWVDKEEAEARALAKRKADLAL